MRTYTTSKTLRGILLLVLFAVGAWAADISGRWQGEWTDARDIPQCSFTFKQDGASLTGTVTDPNGDLPIRDGKVNGDTLSFTVVHSIGSREVTAVYNGRVDGGAINLTVVLPGSERDWHMTAKKVQ